MRLLRALHFPPNPQRNKIVFCKFESRIQIISVTKYLKCSYYFAHLKSAIDLLLGLLPADELAAVDGEDPFYRECRDAINAQAANRLGVSVDELINLAGIDRKKGIQEVITCAFQRWGTVSESAWALYPSCLVFAIV